MADDSLIEARYREDQSLIATDLESCLDQVQSSGTFGVFGKPDQQNINPFLSIQGIGTIGLPLSKREARVIIEASRKAPFGQGRNTIVDESIRKTWEIDAEKVTFKNPKWNQFLSSVLQKTAEELGVGNEVTAKFYKLLMYEEGAMFKPHRDTEKVPGMFGTLVICLPSKHEGGELHLTHGKSTKIFKTAGSSELGVSFLAWYADVIHEVKPVTSGYRFVLTYNLVKEHAHSLGLPTAAGLDHQEVVGRILRAWNKESAVAYDSAPSFLCYLLEYKYTNSSLSFANLKGIDRQRVQLFARACEHGNCLLFLGNLVKMVSGSCDDYDCEYDWQYGYDEDEDEDEHHSIGDEIDSSLSLEHVVDLDGSLRLADVDITEDDIIQLEPFEGREPDNEDFQGFTGNEGATTTHWYRNSALLLLPRAQYVPFIIRNKLERSKDIASDIHHLRREFESADNLGEERRDLETACTIILERDWKEDGTEVHHWRYVSSRRATPEALGAVALSCVVLDRVDLLQKCVGQADAGLPVSSFREMGCAISPELWPRVRSSIEIAVKKFPGLLSRMEAMEQFRKGFLQSIFSASRAYLSATSSKILASELTAWSQDIAKDSLDLAPSGVQDARALVQAAVHYGKDMLYNQIVPYVKHNSNESPFAVAFLVDILQGCSTVSKEEAKKSFELLVEEVALNFNPSAFHQKTMTPQSSHWPWQAPAYNTEQPIRESDDGRRVAQLYGLVINRNHFELGRQILANIWTNLSIIAVEDFERVWMPFLHHLARTIPSISQPFSETSIRTIFYEILTKYLKRVVQVQPSKPENWSRTMTRCSCRDCIGLNSFLASPTQQVGRFPMGKDRRRHLHEQLDLIVGQSNFTERGGNPQTLVVTKDTKAWEVNFSTWRKRKEKAAAWFSQFRAGILKEALAEHYDDVMQMRMIKLPQVPVTGHKRKRAANSESCA